MSVILGVKKTKHILIASDRRRANANGLFTDDNSKLFEVNEHLAFTGAGNCGFVDGVIKQLSISVNKEKMLTEDLIEIVKKEYRLTKAACMLRKLTDKNFNDNSASCCAFIAGLDKNNKVRLFFASDVSDCGELSFTEFDTLIIPPLGTSSKECTKILNTYLYECPLECAKKTINDIATINNHVSVSGDVWIFDLLKKCGKLKSF